MGGDRLSFVRGRYRSSNFCMMHEFGSRASSCGSSAIDVCARCWIYSIYVGLRTFNAFVYANQLPLLLGSQFGFELASIHTGGGIAECLELITAETCDAWT